MFLFVPKIQKHQSDQEGHDDQYVDRDACSLSGTLLPCVSIFGHIRELSITRFVEEEVGEVGGGGHFFLLVLFFSLIKCRNRNGDGLYVMLRMAEVWRIVRNM